jgi:hypothetical protein
VTRYRDLEGTLRWIVVHHSALPEAPGPLAILRYHLDVSKYADIGYHYVVGRQGQIWQGRDIHCMGGHAGITSEAVQRARDIRRGRVPGRIEDARRLDPDWGSIGVVVDGFFFGARPTADQIRSLAWLIGHLMIRYDIPASRVITHREVRERIVLAQGLTPHPKIPNCPGPGLQRVVDELRAGSTATGSPPVDLLRAVEAAVIAATADIVYWHAAMLRLGKGAFQHPVELRLVFGRDGRVLGASVRSGGRMNALLRASLRQVAEGLRIPDGLAKGPIEVAVRFRMAFDNPGPRG